MRKSTLLLSFATAVFASSTAYLALELRSRDEPSGNGSTLAAHRLEPASSAAAEATLPEMPAAPVAARDFTKQPAVAAPAGPGASPSTAKESASKGDLLSDATASFARQQLARLNDPVQRAALLDDARATVRRQYARLRERLKLDDATFEQLVTLMAEKTLQAQEIYVRCAAEPDCSAEETFKRHPVDDHSQELLALLGPNDVEALTKYQASLGERDAVAQLRGRLTETNSIRDDQAEALVSALAEERDRYQKETSARGSQLQGWGTNLGMIFYSGDSNSVEQRLAEASQYSQRLRQRASGVLSPAQLAAFNQMQDELLAQMAAFMRPASTSNKLRT